MRARWTAQLAAAALSIPGVASADIVHDSTTSSSSSGTSLNLNHTIGGGTDRLLVVCIVVEGSLGNADLTAPPQYNGVNMSKAVDRIVGTSYDLNAEIWYMLESDLPAAGTWQVSIEAANADAITAGAISVTGADQQGPEATAFSDDGESGASSIQADITTLTDFAWVFDCVGSGDGITAFSPDAGQTERFDTGPVGSHAAGSTELKATAGLETQGWTAVGASSRMAQVVAAFAPATMVNYRSIGTNTAVLYSTGDASVSAGSDVVTFGGGASLPANIGPGDRLQIAAAGSVTRLESVVGNGTASPVTMPSIQGGTDQTYVLMVTTLDNQDVTNVTGGGLTWTERLEQCAGRNTTGIRVYTAQGSPGGAFQAQVAYAPGSQPLAAALTRYAGVLAIEDPTGENTNGEGGACSGGTDDTTAQITLTSTENGSCHVIGVASGRRNVVGTTAGYEAVATETAGASGTTTKIYTYEKTFDPAATETFQATVNMNVDWATGGVVLRPFGAESGNTLFVLSRDSDTQITVQQPAVTTQSSEPYTIERSYNTLQAWENDRQGDLVGDDRREIGVCYNDGIFAAPLTISGSTTDASRYMKLTVAPGGRHTGVEDSGAILDAASGFGQHMIQVEDEYTRIEWLQLRQVQDGEYSAVNFAAAPSGANGTVANVMAYDCWFSGSNAGVRTEAADVTIRDCVFRACGNYGVIVDAAGASATVRNVTVYGCTQGVGSTAGTTISVRNTIAVNNSVDFQLWATISAFDHNMYGAVQGFDPALFEGSNQAPPADLDHLFRSVVDPFDFHLEPVGHKAVNTGLDLSTSLTVDIDGETRTGSWDIGADEVPPTPALLTWQEVEP